MPLIAVTLLSACAGGQVRAAPAQPASGPAGDYPMVLGDPFTVDGTTYTPADTVNYDAVGFAVAGAEGGSAITAAHRTLPLPSYAEVTSLTTGRTILVRLERRGPMTGQTLIELSPGAAAQLGLIGNDRLAVRLRRTNPPETERALLRTGQAAGLRMDTPKSLLTVLQRRLDQQGTGPTRPLVTASPVAAPSAMAVPTVTQPSIETPAAIAPRPAIAATTAAVPAPKVVTVKPAPKAVAPDPKSAATVKKSDGAKPAVNAGTGWFVQIGSFASKANADAAAAKTGAQASQSGKLWRVRIGPFPDADKARPALAKVKAAGYKDAVIQRAG